MNSGKRTPKDRSDYVDRKRAAHLAAVREATRAKNQLPSFVYDPPADPERRQRASESLRVHIEEYRESDFKGEFADYHLDLISQIEAAVVYGGWYCCAVPRGGGKSSIALAAIEWALLHGKKRWPVVIGATDTLARDIVKSLCVQLQANDLYLEDFPESCVAFSSCTPMNQRHQTTPQGLRTGIGVGTDLVFPCIEQDLIQHDFANGAAGSRVTSFGITGAIRGQRATTQFLETIRPDFAIADDPQSRESSASRKQSKDRFDILTGDIAYLNGPETRMSLVVPGTVIYKGDLVDSLLDRQINPEFRGSKHKMLVSEPKNVKFWEDYFEKRRDFLRRNVAPEIYEKALDEHYEAHRAVADEGCKVSWPWRTEGRVSAIQACLHRREQNPSAFAAEMQQEPQIQQQDVFEKAEPNQIVVKQHHLKRFDKDSGLIQAPLWVDKVVASIDVQHNLLYHGVLGGSMDFEVGVLDYATTPDQQRRYFSKSGDIRGLSDLMPRENLKTRLYLAIQAQIEHFAELEIRREDGLLLQIDLIVIDAADNQEVVFRAIRESPHANRCLPCRGVYYGAKGRQFIDIPFRDGERLGNRWHIKRNANSNMLVMNRDSNWWKTESHRGWKAPMSSSGCISLFKQEPERHRLFADHQDAESAVVVKANEREVVEWTEQSTRPDNDYFDKLCQGLAGLSTLGCLGPGHLPERKRRTRRLQLVPGI